jgi:hypothetical protein
MNMYMGYYYDIPQKGKGHRLEASFGSGSLLFDPITKSSALSIKREMLKNGYSKEDITITKNR